MCVLVISYNCKVMTNKSESAVALNVISVFIDIVIILQIKKLPV